MNLDLFGQYYPTLNSQTIANASNDIQESSQNNYPQQIKQEENQSNFLQHTEEEENQDNYLQHIEEVNQNNHPQHIKQDDQQPATLSDIQERSQNNHPQQIKQEVSQSNHLQHIKQEDQPSATLEAPPRQTGESSSSAVHQTPAHASFPCTLCNKTFNSSRALDNHNNAKHKTVKCPHCKKAFRFQKALEQHQRMKHAPPQIAPLQAIKQEPERPSEPMTPASMHIHPEEMDDDVPPADNQPGQPGDYTLGDMYWHPADPEGWGYDIPPEVNHGNNQDGESHHSSDPDSNQKSDSMDVKDEYSNDDNVENEEPDVCPEHGVKHIRCLAFRLNCRRVFHKASDMFYHFETRHQADISLHPDALPILFNAVPRSERHNLFNSETNLYYCPHCGETPHGIFESLSFMVKHAESNLCDLEVRRSAIAC
ncbi:zinc c2h2like [Fusarium sporotrichioides]|uniref:Zinc c2h2like n=1 Tax=Fusarium sporotrichioides TaxID=5514 RepID=A0A395S1N8_FUSSP|nr:zinc c2h2like [Fusarium sporotrichioides]